MGWIASCIISTPHDIFFVFQTIVDAALSGFGPLYGRMMPYLHEVELEEHYFIQGPRVGRSEAVVYFAKLGKDS